MYLKLSNWFATTTTKTTETWGNGARICRAIGRRPTDWSKNKERLIKNIAEIETIAEEFGLEVLVLEKGENPINKVYAQAMTDLKRERESVEYWKDIADELKDKLRSVPKSLY